MNFFSAYDQGFVRVAAATSHSALADPLTNADRLIAQAEDISQQSAAVVVFPELSVTGYSIDDLHMSELVLSDTHSALERLREASGELFPVLIVGAPLRRGNRLYNCAVVIHRGEFLGVVPKSYLPNYREFYEKRQFAAGVDTSGEIRVAGRTVPFGTDLMFEARDIPDFILHVEICEDLWVPLPPSSAAALAGATVLTNLSGSPITIGKSSERHRLCADASSRAMAAYVYCSGGPGESSTDLAWDGQTMIFESGRLLAETQRFPATPQFCLADVDLSRIRADRLRNGSFDDNAIAATSVIPEFRRIGFTLEAPSHDIGLHRVVDRFPFVPDSYEDLAQDCFEAYNIQVAGLEQRIRAIGEPRLVIGVSGGLDSTQALLVCAKAMDLLGRPRSDILAFTMPGFATTEHTKNNATKLAEALGVSFETIDIRPSAQQMLADMGHPAGEGTAQYDVTFENVQAGLRYDYLFRIANQRGGIVVGTGDLSELALGWCTYGVGDQMSHYGVNAGVPKTLMQHLIRWIISSGQFGSEENAILDSILDTEITPELVPTKPGEVPQSTEAVIGPYELQDFNLYYTVRYGLRPQRIAFLAWHAWRDVEHGAWPPNYPVEERNAYSLSTIKQWLSLFCRRFVTNQFKRSTLPNGPKVVSGGTLSPRGDWRMPSDVSPRAWLADVEQVPEVAPLS